MPLSPRTLGTTIQPTDITTPPTAQTYFTENCDTLVTFEFLNELIRIFIVAQTAYSVTNSPNDINALKNLMDKLRTGGYNFSVSDLIINKTGDVDVGLTIQQGGAIKGNFIYDDSENVVAINRYADVGGAFLGNLLFYENKFFFNNLPVEVEDLIKVDTIQEYTANSGVTLDSTILKDGNAILTGLKLFFGVESNNDFVQFNNANSYLSGYENNVLGNMNIRFGDAILKNITADNVTIGGNQVYHAGNDGVDSGLNADLFDDLQASQFLRSDADDVITGLLDFSRGANQQVRVGYNTGASRQPTIEIYDGLTTRHGYVQGNTGGYIGLYSNAGGILLVQGVGDTRVNGLPVLLGGQTNLYMGINNLYFGSSSNLDGIQFNDTTDTFSFVENGSVANSIVAAGKVDVNTIQVGSGGETAYLNEKVTFTPTFNGAPSATTRVGYAIRNGDHVDGYIFIAGTAAQRASLASGTALTIGNIPWVTELTTDRKSMCQVIEEKGTYFYENRAESSSGIVSASSDVIYINHQLEGDRIPKTYDQWASGDFTFRIHFSFICG